MNLRVPVAFVAMAAGALGQTYIDSARCGDCHREIAEKWAKTGMAQSFAAVTSTAEFAELQARPLTHKASGDTFGITVSGGAPQLRRWQTVFGGAIGNVLEKPIAYRFGSGEHSKSYFGRDAAGNLVELPVSWYSEAGGVWRMSPGFDAAQHAGFSRKVNPQCLFCHNAYPAAGETQVRAVGIDCQRCHGPGSEHAANPARGVVNPAKLSPTRRMEVCLQCHLETTNLALPGEVLRYGLDVFSYKPGEPLSDYALFFDHQAGAGYDDKFEFSSAPYRLFKSACFRGSRESMTCTTCHDPHGGERSASSYAAVCKSCHPASQLAAKKHPAGVDCVSCHMAQRHPSDAIHVTVTDHLIARKPVKDAPGVLTERNGLNLKPYRGEVAPYYPAGMEKLPEFDLYWAVAQVRNQANLAAGIPALEAAIERLRPAQDGPYLELAEALRVSGQREKAIARYREAVARGPAYWRTHYGLALGLRSTDALGALTSLARALELAPGEPSIYEMAASIRSASNQMPEALATLRAGIRAVPDSADLHNNLGTALLRAGDLKGAEVAFREAVRLRPELAAMRMNLASMLAQDRRVAEAGFEFDRAVALHPESPEIHSAYGAALGSWGRLQDARRELETALRLNPQLANTHNNLGVVLRQLGDEAGARREFQSASKLGGGAGR